jgi:hypothetical protein
MADKCKYDLNVSENRDTPRPKIEDEFEGEDDLVAAAPRCERYRLDPHSHTLTFALVRC